MNMENIMTCAKCGYQGSDSYFTIVRHYEREDDVEDWCLDCFFEEYEYCGDCGRAVLLDELYETESGSRYCEKCYPYYADEE
jgi:hypothetical protein